MSNPIVYKSVDLLDFDPENPRLPSAINKKDEQAVLKWMLEDAGIIELMASIGEKDYFSGEPLLIVPKKNAEKLLVVEGNRRLTAAKLLLNPDLAPIRKKAVQQVYDEAIHHPKELPVVVFSERQEILDYLGYRHVTGVKTWGSLAKAKYLKQLLDNLISEKSDPDKQNRILAKTIGSRADAVARRLAGYAVYEVMKEEDFFDLSGLNEQSINFSILTTALNFKNIPDFVGMEDSKDRTLENLNKVHLKELTSWLFKKDSEGRTRLGESRNLGDLNSILGEKTALEAFRQGIPLNQAVVYTEKPSEIFRLAYTEAIGRLEVARDYVHRVEDLSQVDADQLLDIQKLARALRSIVDDKLDDLDD